MNLIQLIKGQSKSICWIWTHNLLIHLSNHNATESLPYLSEGDFEGLYIASKDRFHLISWLNSDELISNIHHLGKTWVLFSRADNLLHYFVLVLSKRVWYHKKTGGKKLKMLKINPVNKATVSYQLCVPLAGPMGCQIRTPSQCPNYFIFSQSSVRSLQNNTLEHPLWELAPPEENNGSATVFRWCIPQHTWKKVFSQLWLELDTILGAIIINNVRVWIECPLTKWSLSFIPCSLIV